MLAEKVRHLLHLYLLNYNKMVTQVIAFFHLLKKLELPFQLQIELTTALK